MRMLVTAAPGIDDIRVRRSELERVWLKPGSSGLDDELRAVLGDDVFGQGGALRNQRGFLFSFSAPRYLITR